MPRVNGYVPGTPSVSDESGSTSSAVYSGSTSDAEFVKPMSRSSPLA